MSKVIAVGALGGSGTRAIADVLIKAGIYMGDDLNTPNDNLIFSRLFRNPDWFSDASSFEINERLEIFREYMENDCLSLNNSRKLFNAALSNKSFKSSYSFIFDILGYTIRRRKNRELWGWKEPNTHIYLDSISKYFNDLKYVHVLRNGLDMAFSKNKRQVNNWGNLFGISVEDVSSNLLPVKQLDFWIESTRKVIAWGEVNKGKLLLINHSKFSSNPKEEIERLFRFIDLKLSNDVLDKLYIIPKVQKSENRFKHYDLKIFTEEQLDFVKSMGF